jgi:hypothetical protein
MTLTPQGKPVATEVATEDFERLERLRATGPERGLASIAGGWEESDDLVEAILSQARTFPR